MKTSKVFKMFLPVVLSVQAAAILNAQNLYWDANGTTAGAGTDPTGTWGTDNFWNTSATGENGTFSENTTSSDTLYFSAYLRAGGTNPTTAYTVTVNGIQDAAGLRIQSPTKVTLTGGTIRIGTGGITLVRNLPDNVGNTNDNFGAQIDSDIELLGDQQWESNVTNSSGGSGFFVNGSISGNGNLTLRQTANRTYQVNGDINHTGSLTINGNNANGTIDLFGNIGTSVTQITVNNITTLRLNGDLTGAESYAGNYYVGASSGGATHTSRLTLASNTAINPRSTVTLSAPNGSSSATLNLGNGANSYDVTIAGLNSGATNGTVRVTNLSTGSGTATLTVGTDLNPVDSLFAGVIQDGTTAKVALTKDGSGTLTLTGANTYTGDTLVNAGTLLVNGSLGATDVTVKSGAILGGTGSIGGSLHFEAGAKLVFDLTTPLTLNGGETTTVSFGGFSVADLVGLDSSVEYGVYTLIDGNATFDFTNVANFGAANAYDLGGGKLAYFQEGSFELVIAAVPEPSTGALLLLGGFGTVCFLRRRTARRNAM